MKKTETTTTPCHICGEIVCKDSDSCYIEHLAQRADAHAHWVSDCEDRKIWRDIDSKYREKWNLELASGKK